MKTKRIVSFLLALLLTVTAIPYVSLPANAVDEAEEIAGTMAVASESFAPGDLNHDGYVNTTDVVTLRRYVADGYGITLDDREADLNGDTYINTTDVVLLRRFIAGGYGVELKPNLPAPGCNHSVKIDAAVEPTCTTTGLTEGKHCEKCGEILVAQQIVPAKGHIEETIPGKNATCVEDGISEGKKCSVCGVVLVAQETIGKRHNYVDGICSVCGKQEATPDEYFTFTLLEDGTYSIGAKAIYKIPAELVIPESYQGQPVTVIEDKAFYPCDNLVSVTIPNSVTSITEMCLHFCSNLRHKPFW